MTEVLDDTELIEMDLEYWRNLYNGLIEGTDSELMKDHYRKCLKVKEEELEAMLNG